MMHRIIGFSLLLVAARPVQAQDTTAQPIGDEAYRAVITFFEYDRTIPLDARVLARTEEQTYVREKIVFTGGRGDRVPAYLAYPKLGTPPYPLVLTMHAGASSKDAWWQDGSFEHGLQLTQALLDAGVAVLSLDAQYHGERSVNNDYLSIYEMYFEKEWFARYRDMLVESARDHMRALDYIESRTEIDRSRIGVIGLSMGGLTTVYVTALEPSVKAAVVCSGGAHFSWLEPLNPVNFARALSDRPVLVLAGRSDPMMTAEATEHFFDLIGGSSKSLQFFDSGHRLPPTYVDQAFQWFLQHLR